MKEQKTSHGDDEVTKEAELLDIESGLLLQQVQRKEPLDATRGILNILQGYLAQPALSTTQMISKLQKLDKTYYYPGLEIFNKGGRKKIKEEV